MPSTVRLALVTCRQVSISNMGRKKHLDSYTITETWRRLVEARMLERGMGVNELAAKVGITHGAVSQMLKTVKSSPHVAAIHEALGWPEPATSEDSIDEDERLAEIRHGWDSLSDPDRDHVLAMFRRLVPAT